MDKPHVVAFLGLESELVLLEYSDAKKMIQETKYELGVLDAMGFVKASETIGGQLLRTIAFWHMDDFNRYRNLRYEQQYEDDLDTIGFLISRSIRKKTQQHVETIQALIDDIVTSSPELAKLKAITDWPIIRQRIVELSSG